MKYVEYFMGTVLALGALFVGGMMIALSVGYILKAGI